MCSTLYQELLHSLPIRTLPTIEQLSCFNSASFNPARDMGPRLVLAAARWKMAAFHDCLPYLFGPLVGGPVGAFFADKVLYMNEYIQ